MIRLLLLAATITLILSGLSLLISALLPFAAEFAALKVASTDLLPRILRLVSGMFLLGASRWTLQAALRNRE